ncbi:response regulator [Streptomyces diastatochromogenes]|nr:response regulator [Streptomyces diastatochromogenes]
MSPSVVPESSGPVRPLILFALTDARVVDVVGGMLREQGHEVRQTVDGPATRQALRERPGPQGVVLSLELPRCDPWEFLKELRDRARVMPIVVVAPCTSRSTRPAPTTRGGRLPDVRHLPRAGLPRVAARFRRLLPVSGAPGTARPVRPGAGRRRRPGQARGPRRRDPARPHAAGVRPAGSVRRPARAGPRARVAARRGVGRTRTPTRGA